ncbi:unnamed protein product [Linum tenue]|uniref:Uncharacterized protein n=1 Tax=Linum tenue TaxID=586396 RepID=A0AAV0Q8C9_9ROSI|nr:unnamed protein product [Linum tenue]
MADIIRIAAARFIDSSSTEPADPPASANSDDENDDVELVLHLLRAADELDHKQYEQAAHSLDLCELLSSEAGDLTQRVTHYFVQALREKIRNETAAAAATQQPKPDLIDELKRLNLEEAVTATCPLVGVMYIGQLAGVQAIVETVEESKRVHIIDFRIRNGIQWTALMQALSPSSGRRRVTLEILKITAIVTVSENLVRETGERLAKFAESMNIPFSFNSIVVSSLIEIDETKFDLDPNETVAVFSEYALQSLIPDPNQLDALMTVVKNIQPGIMVVIETECNLNSSNFGRRFVEVLFHYGAYFDCVDACLEGGDGGGERGLMESMFLSRIVTGLLVKEGKYMAKFVTVDVWRKFLSRFSMWEVRLSSSAMYVVNLLLERFVGGKFCTLDRDGESLVVGWKGTPMFSLATWKFLQFKTTEPNPEEEEKEDDSESIIS